MSGRYEYINGVPQFEQGGHMTGTMGDIVAGLSVRRVAIPIKPMEFMGVIQGSPVKIDRALLNMVGSRYGSNIPSNPTQPSQEDLLMFYRRRIPYPLDITEDPVFDYGQRSAKTAPPVALNDL